MQNCNQYCFFFFSEVDYSVSGDELDVNMTMVDDEATLTMVEDLSASEEAVPAERITLGNAPQNLVSVSLVNSAEQPFDQLPVLTTPLPQPPEQLTPEQSSNHIPAAPPALPSEQLTSQQPLNHIQGPTAPQPLHPEYLTNAPSASVPSVQPEAESLTGNCSKVLVDLEKAFSDLTSISNVEDLLELHNRIRVVVSVEKLMELKGTHCSVAVSGAVCGLSLQYSAKHIGARIDLEWKCAGGHCGKWESSEVLTTNRHSKVFVNDSLLPIAIVLSGNNYAKFSLFCKVLNLSHTSKSNFCNFQTKCALPVVRDVWSKMRQLVLEILKGYKDICLCGDGRNDSPGHSARYCVYTLMEHVTKVVVALEVIDKRETGGNSAVMEREGLRRLLERLMSELPLNELCTDASSTIIKLVRDMKGRVQRHLLFKFCTFYHAQYVLYFRLLVFLDHSIRKKLIFNQQPAKVILSIL